MRRLILSLGILISLAGGASAGLVVSIADYEIPEPSLNSPVVFDVLVTNNGPAAQSFNFFRLDFQIATLANPTGNSFRFSTPQPNSATYRSAANNYALGSFGAATNVTGQPKSFMTINGGGSSVTIRDGIVTNQGANSNVTNLAAGGSMLLARLQVEAVDGSFNFGDKFRVTGSAVRDSGDPVVFHGAPGFTLRPLVQPSLPALVCLRSTIMGPLLIQVTTHGF